jgi:hydroxymethylpyrimidine/phosphomethylpyrimidine kinase
MLASAETVSVVAETLHAQQVTIIVLDPVGLPPVILPSLRR